MMLTRTPREIWEIALGELQVQVSKANYRTWFGKTAGLSYQDGRFIIGVPNTFIAEYLKKNQLSLIERALAGLTTADVRVEFQVDGQSLPREESDAALPVPEPVYTRLNPRYVFDAFIEGGGNHLARAAALSVARNPGRGYNPLFIYGGVGLGKTHLLHAIGHEAAARHINVICTSAEQFTNEFVAALRERSTEEFRNKYRSIGVLLIDDIHFIAGKEQTEESFFHTFNELHNTDRQIVITSDRPPKDMPLLEERLRSRFEWGLIVDIQPPDLATRLAILQSKARARGIAVGTEVLELLAQRARHNIRELEGLLNRVAAFARLTGAPPDLELAARAIRDITAVEPAPASGHAAIVAAVAAGFELTPEDLCGRKRDKETALARRVAMYLLRQSSGLSLAQIGQELGRRDAAAANLACKKVADDIVSNPFLKRKVRDIQQIINNHQPSPAAR